MSDRLWIAARFARLPNQCTTFDGSGHSRVRCVPAFVLLTPCPSNFDSVLDSTVCFCSGAVVCANPIQVFISMRFDVMLAALLAFVEVAISHLGVFVELFDWLDGIALETLFETRHGSSCVRMVLPIIVPF
jgi:hypothetical protein